jgi:hypothetical protein
MIFHHKFTIIKYIITIIININNIYNKIIDNFKNINNTNKQNNTKIIFIDINNMLNLMI